jgi:hypothetical protein
VQSFFDLDDARLLPWNRVFVFRVAARNSESDCVGTSLDHRQSARLGFLAPDDAPRHAGLGQQESGQRVTYNYGDVRLFGRTSD